MKRKAVHILDIFKALLICKLVIFSTFGLMLLFGIFTPSSIFRPSFYTHNVYQSYVYTYVKEESTLPPDISGDNALPGL